MSIWLEIIKGIGGFIFLFLMLIFCRERGGIFPALIFILGLILLFVYPPIIYLKYSILLIIIIILWLIFNLCSAIIGRKKLEEETWLLFFDKYKKRGRHYVSRDWRDYRNAWIDRFGRPVIGAKNWFWALLGREGYSESVKKSFLLHEWGHYIFAIPMIFIESFIAYIFIINIPKSILLIPSYYALITITSWLYELLADSVSGVYGFARLKDSLEKEEMGVIDFFLPGFGFLSHPPELLRCIAYIFPPYISPLIIPAFIVIYYFYFMKG